MALRMKQKKFHLPEHHPAAIAEPIRPAHLPVQAQWLAGTGAGSWFYIIAIDHNKPFYSIIRFSPEGEVECERLFVLKNNNFSPSAPYKFVYPSHCALCTILQNDSLLEFHYTEK
jgi:hypothetical protein